MPLAEFIHDLIGTWGGGLYTPDPQFFLETGGAVRFIIRKTAYHPERYTLTVREYRSEEDTEDETRRS